jgi:hypothetical protein
MSYFYSRIPFLMERPLPKTLNLYTAFFLARSMCVDQVSRVARFTPKITGGIDPEDWLPEELKWLGFREPPNRLSDEHRSDLRDIDPFFQPPFWVAEICLQVLRNSAD